MKICQLCRKLYDFDMQFCTEDGNLLVSRNIYLTNVENVLKNSLPNEASQPTIIVSMPLPYLPEAPIHSKRSLRLGLVSLVAIVFLLCGGFIWAAVKLAASERSSGKMTVAGRTSVNVPKPKKVDSSKTKLVGLSGNNITSDQSNNQKLKTSDSNKSVTDKPVKTSTPNVYNGRVIMLNAVVRTAPATEAGEMAILPLDEPVQIGQSAGPNSPWYRVVTVSGIKGWMHGSTIEFH